MKKITMVFSFIIFVVFLTAKNNQLGIGISAGNESGVTGKYYLSNNKAVDIDLAWDLGNDSALHINADLLNEKRIAFENISLPTYYGVGVFLGLRDDLALGARFPLGLNYFIEKVPIELFIEIAPGLRLIEDTDFYIGGAFGFRYYFQK